MRNKRRRRRRRRGVCRETQFVEVVGSKRREGVVVDDCRGVVLGTIKVGGVEEGGGEEGRVQEGRRGGGRSWGV